MTATEIVYVLCVKTAVTDLFAVMLMTHAPEPVQSPIQLAKAQPDAGTGVSVTLVPSRYGSRMSRLPPGPV